MDDSFFAYLEQLELMAFFSGYALIYLGVRLLGKSLLARGIIKTDPVSLLPLAYALVGVLYLGLQLKNLYPDYSIENIKASVQLPYLRLWGILSLLFFVPALRKRPVISLCHSLVFFFFIARDLFIYIFRSADRDALKNDMNIYTNSLLVNLGAFVFVALVYFLFMRIGKRNKKSPDPSGN
jgi:hypothetical protein